MEESKPDLLFVPRTRNGHLGIFKNKILEDISRDGIKRRGALIGIGDVPKNY